MKTQYPRPPAAESQLVEQPASLDDRLFRERVQWVAQRVGTIAELARRAGINEATLRQWITGPNQPNRQRLVATAAAAEVSAAWLAAGVGIHYPFPWIEPEALSSALSSEEFRARLRGLVEWFGTPTALAREAELSEATLRRWLEGSSEPRRVHCIALARACKIDLEWLLTGEGILNSGPAGAYWTLQPRRLMETTFDRPLPPPLQADAVLPNLVTRDAIKCNQQSAPGFITTPALRHDASKNNLKNMQNDTPESKLSDFDWKAPPMAKDFSVVVYPNDPLADEAVMQQVTGYLMQEIIHQLGFVYTPQRIGRLFTLCLHIIRCASRDAAMANEMAQQERKSIVSCALNLVKFYPEEEVDIGWYPNF